MDGVRNPKSHLFLWGGSINQKSRIITKENKMFLAALVASHKALIAKESKSNGEYSKRAAHADRVAREIERHFSRTRFF